jgi:hypothetical protein
VRRDGRSLVPRGSARRARQRAPGPRATHDPSRGPASYDVASGPSRSSPSCPRRVAQGTIERPARRSQSTGGHTSRFARAANRCAPSPPRAHSDGKAGAISPRGRRTARAARARSAASSAHFLRCALPDRPSPTAGGVDGRAGGRCRRRSGRRRICCTLARVHVGRVAFDPSRVQRPQSSPPSSFLRVRSAHEPWRKSWLPEP